MHSLWNQAATSPTGWMGAGPAAAAAKTSAPNGSSAATITVAAAAAGAAAGRTTAAGGGVGAARAGTGGDATSGNSSGAKGLAAAAGGCCGAAEPGLPSEDSRSMTVAGAVAAANATPIVAWAPGSAAGDAIAPGDAVPLAFGGVSLKSAEAGYQGRKCATSQNVTTYGGAIACSPSRSSRSAASLAAAVAMPGAVPGRPSEGGGAEAPPAASSSAPSGRFIQAGRSRASSVSSPYRAAEPPPCSTPLREALQL